MTNVTTGFEMGEEVGEVLLATAKGQTGDN